MKTIKIENRIIYIILTFSLFLLHFNDLSLLSIIFSNLIASFIILLFDKINIYKYKLTKYILLIISLIIFPYYLNKISYYIADNILRDYSIIIISLTLLISIIYLIRKEYHTIVKVILLSTYFIVFIVLFGLILSFFYVNIDNINLLFLKENNLISNTLNYSLKIIYCYFLIYPITKTKYLIKDSLITISIQTFSYLFNLLILGSLINFIKYPYIVVFKKIKLTYFIERIDIWFSLNYLFIFYFFILLIYYQIYYILKKRIKKKKLLKILLTIISLVLFIISLII